MLLDNSGRPANQPDTSVSFAISTEGSTQEMAEWTEDVSARTFTYDAARWMVKA
jgi:hypothetical protein